MPTSTTAKVISPVRPSLTGVGASAGCGNCSAKNRAQGELACPELVEGPNMIQPMKTENGIKIATGTIMNHSALAACSSCASCASASCDVPANSGCRIPRSEGSTCPRYDPKNVTKSNRHM